MDRCSNILNSEMDIAEQETLVSYYARLSHPYLGRSNNVAGILALYVFPFAARARYRRSAIFYLFGAQSGLALLLTLSRRCDPRCTCHDGCCVSNFDEASIPVAARLNGSRAAVGGSRVCGHCGGTDRGS